MNYQNIIDQYYSEENALRRILLVHSRQVMERALRIADAHPELAIDRPFVQEAAMLHDIGIFLCDAPGIACHGKEPYICHGRLGAELTKAEIVAQHLPIPAQDFLPETLEERLICYADKFYSKSHLDRVKTPEQAERSLSKFGQEGVARFRQWRQLFEPDTL